MFIVFQICIWKLHKLQILKFYCIVEYLLIFQYSKNNFGVYFKKRMKFAFYLEYCE